MKIKIEYKANDSERYPCRAVATLEDGRSAAGIGKTWIEAKKDAIDEAKSLPGDAGAPPPSEEVEV